MSSDRLQRELAQIGARATLTSLGVESVARWQYRSERVVRNLTAAGLAALSSASSEIADQPQRSELVAIAQGWEHLAVLGESVHPSTALLNAAVFYELAGFQANATCLARMSTRSTRWTTQPDFDGLVSAFLQRLFLRVRDVSAALSSPPPARSSFAPGELERRASQAVAALGLDSAAMFFLTGESAFVEESLQKLSLARRGFAEVGDAVAFNTLDALQSLLPFMVERSTWVRLGPITSAPRWQRYLKVLARGLGSDILDSRSISELWPSQRIAVDSGLLSDEESLAIRMPTSAGKTRVAELAIVHTLVSHPGSKCIYIAPYRALANEVEESFSNLFQDLGYGASTVPGGYDQDEMSEELVSTDDVLVLTPEKLDLLFRLRADFLDEVRLIVIDEGHIVADRQRGPKFELLVSRLRRRAPLARFLMMSAVVPDATLRDFAVWLGGSPDRSASTDWRPSILKHGQLEWDGSRGTLRYASGDVTAGGLEFVPNLIVQSEYAYMAETGRIRRPKFPRPGNKGDVATEVAYRFSPLGPVLIFAMQTNWAESIASSMLQRIELAERTGETVNPAFVLRQDGRAAAVAEEWLGADHLIPRLLRRGIAFHHGRLPDAVRDAIEDDFRARRLAVLVATSTLAQGVNLPVRTVVFHSVRSHDADGTSRVLSSREYWNIAGRAGRAGAETEGTVIHITTAPFDADDFRRYAIQRHSVERVESALHHMLQDLVNDRLSSDEAAEQLDADLLALLVEEDEGALDSQILEDTLTSSLFHVQALETRTPVERLIRVMTSTAQRISREVPDLGRRRLFAGTGLSSRSCLAIAAHAESHEAQLSDLLTVGELGDRDELVDLLLDGLTEVREMETRADLPVDKRELLFSWIDGRQVREVATELGIQDPQDLTEYIEDAFSYRLPWGASGYLRIAGAIADVPSPSTLAANLAGMIKYGVPSPEAAWAMTTGIASRRAAIAVAGEYLRTGGVRSAAAFRRWIGRLDPESLAEQFGFVGAELESTARAVLRSQPNEYLAALDGGAPLLPMRASCRPTKFAVDTGLAYEVGVGDLLVLRRDRDSRLNRNAVVVLSGRQLVGYLQVDAARALGPELDAGLDVVASVVAIAEPPSQLQFDLEIVEATAADR